MEENKQVAERELKCSEKEEYWARLGDFPRAINFPAADHGLCLPAGRGPGHRAPWPPVGKEGWLRVCLCGTCGLLQPSVGSQGGAGASCPVLGSSCGQNQLESSLEPGGKGALLAQRTQARRKITYQAALSMLV